MFRLFRQRKSEAPGAPEPQESTQDQVLIEAAGRSRITEVATSARKVPWSLNLLQLLWAAGPVTFLAMQGGYFLGFGHAAPTQNFVFFAVYTLLFGVIGLIARFVADATRGRRQERSQVQLRNTIDLLPDLLFATRDLAMGEMTPDMRRRQSAAVLLHEVEVSPEAVAVAVREMTGDPTLASTAEQIEIYRRLGLHARVADLVEATADARMAALERLHAEDSELAELLRDRLQGVAPTREEGVRRIDQFLERLFSAADADDLSRCSLDDVQAIFVLAFELMNGRQIKRLTFEWSGSWQLGRALDRLEYQGNRFRVAQAGVISRLRSLAMLLAHSETSGITQQHLREPLPVLGQQVLAGLHAMLAAEPDVRTADGRILGVAMAQVDELREARNRLMQAQSRYGDAAERWGALRRRERDRKGGRRWEMRSARRIRVSEELIELDDNQKIKLADGLCEYLEELQIRREGDFIYFGKKPLDNETAKRIGIQLALLLDPLVDLTNPSIQRAIYSSPAAYLGGLYVGMSADAKAGLGSAMVRMVRQDLGRTAEWLALRLTRVYHLPLTEGLREFLQRQYGANPERLAMLAQNTGDESHHPVALRAERSPEFDAMLQDKEWGRLLRRGARYRQAEEARQN
ncbi:hypothetical protein D893_00218 [Thioalkalivibrio sp. ALE21]|uniref:hypothetical protein n=1 Tax=Thioalkalivibrio sp. ALE21 TaxID=1158175 RepID=UPI000D83C15F|nr:hypothetical protein [Thioalkalivibrio sp. ALE21]PYG04425.1 hypothetical protein D893_00218 [Thioalkalivibrio sp. ALE21]